MSGNHTTETEDTWRFCLLHQVCEVRYGLGQPPEKDPDGVPMIRATNVKRGRISEQGLIRIKKSAIPTSRNPYLKSGDIIVVRSGAYTGDVAMIDDEWAGSVAGYDLVVTPGKQVEPAFCMYALLSPDVQKHFNGLSNRAAQAHINRQQLEATPIPLPPLAEQQAIAKILSTTQKAIKAQERIIQTTTELKQALMQKLFSEGLRGEPQKETEIGLVPESWDVAPLNECAVVQTGVAKGRKEDVEDAVEVPYLRVANVQDGYLDLSEMKTIIIRKKDRRRFALQDGDVVLTEGGDYDKLGRGFIWHGQIKNCVHQNHVFAVRPDKKQLSSEFFAYLSQSPYGKRYFLSVAHKTTNLACINTTKLKAFPVVLPPKDQQAEIVVACSSMDGKIRKATNKMKQLQDLFRTLLHDLMTPETRVHDMKTSIANQ